MVDHGTNLIEEKIQTLQDRLALLKTMQIEIERSEQSYQSPTPERYFLPERACRIAPYEGKLGCDESNELMKQLIMEIYNHDFKLGNACGLLLLRHADNWKQYLFVDIDVKTFTATDSPEILHIPAGWYLCKKIESSGIHNVWDWCLQHLTENQIKLIIETELFVGNYTFSKPVLEQRCLLIDSNMEQDTPD